MKIFYLIILLAALINCGSEQDTSVEDLPDNEAASEEETNADEEDETINTGKLIGTPFEGLTIGDDFDECTLLYNEFRTESMDELPIKVFTAFFTKKEEQEILAGIAIANNAVGYNLFELTDDWEDSHRVIYKVSLIDFPLYNADPIGIIFGIGLKTDENKYSSHQYSDWFIQIEQSSDHEATFKWTTAHELGHAAGLYHNLINYEDDTLGELENNSLMSGNGYYVPPTLTDYTFMMQKQGELIRNNLGEKSVELHDPYCVKIELTSSH